MTHIHDEHNECSYFCKYDDDGDYFDDDALPPAILSCYSSKAPPTTAPADEGNNDDDDEEEEDDDDEAEEDVQGDGDHLSAGSRLLCVHHKLRRTQLLHLHLCNLDHCSTFPF